MFNVDLFVPPTVMDLVREAAKRDLRRFVFTLVAKDHGPARVSVDDDGAMAVNVAFRAECESPRDVNLELSVRALSARSAILGLIRHVIEENNSEASEALRSAKRCRIPAAKANAERKATKHTEASTRLRALGNKIAALWPTPKREAPETISTTDNAETTSTT